MIHRKREDVRGLTLIYGIVSLTSLMMVVSLAVDLARVQVVKTELRRAADAAARYAVAGLSSGVTTAQANAIAAAADNLADGSSVVLDSTSDVEFGAWDSSSLTFTVLTGSNRANANAIRITARRTTARGNATPLTFARVLGRDSCDVTAVSIAMKNQQTVGYGFAGLSSISMSGSSDADSYNANSGAYSSGSAMSNGDVVSNGSINLSGSTRIKGDARAGIGKSLNISSHASVTGSISNLSTALNYPNVDASPYATSNNNSSIPGAYFSNGDLTVKKNQSLTLPGGTYYINDWTLQKNASLTFSGAATLYITGTTSLQGDVFTPSNKPTNLKIRVAGTGAITMSRDADMYADIYAPQSNISISSTGDLYGAAIAKKLTVSSSGSLHYDESLDQQYTTGSGIAVVE